MSSIIFCLLLLPIKKNTMKNKGFTLVELVITIAIVIILSVVSVPIYEGYVEKAMYSEGYALLGTILTAQKAYYSEYGNFLGRAQCSNDSKGYTSYEPILGIDARGNKYFTWFSASGMSGEIKFCFDAWTRKPDGLGMQGKTQLGIYYDITTGGTLYEPR